MWHIVKAGRESGVCGKLVRHRDEDVKDCKKRSIYSRFDG